jgi:hypothetical protein
MAKPSDGLGLLIAAPAEGEETGADDAATLAAEGVLKAIQRKDAGALYRALEEVFQHCQSGGADDSDDDYEDDEV